MATFAQHIAALEGFAARAPAGAEAAANAMADVFKPAVQSVMLSREHGFSTETPAPPGSPAAAISGEMAASVLNEPAIPFGDASFLAKSGPTAPWSRIQELGGHMTPHSEKGMRWQEPPGVWHVDKFGHDLPPRPYLKPTLDAEVEAGTPFDAAADAFSAVVYGR